MVNAIIFSKKNLAPLIFEVFTYLQERNLVASLFRYATETTPNSGKEEERLVKLDDGNGHKLTGLFLKATKESMLERNARRAPRWFETPFVINGQEYYLSSQWNASGNFQLTLPVLNYFLKECCGNEAEGTTFSIYKSGDEFIFAQVDYKKRDDNMRERRERIESEFRSFLSNVAKNEHNSTLSSSSIATFLRVIKSEILFDYNPTKWAHVESVYDITNAEEIEKIIEDLESDPLFKEKDKNDSSYKYHRSVAIKKYREFLDYRNHDKGINTVRQCIFFGAPGTGKSYKVNDVVQNQLTFRTTFHPDYDYAQFVGAYKPKKEGKDITYSFVPQVFAKAYATAWKLQLTRAAETNVFLVIEEINRGNCAQIFGDIFQLLDRDSKGFSQYSIDADCDFAEWLEKEFQAEDVWDAYKEKVDGEGKLKLPSNLNILATMNTSDQSLFPMDSAFKRRFDWEYVPINYSHEKANFDVAGDGIKFKWLTFLKKVNADIYKATESEDKQMGEFFIKPKNDSNEIGLDEFRSKVLFYLWDSVYKDDPSFKNIFHFNYPEKDGSVVTFQRLFAKDHSNNQEIFPEILKQMLKNLDEAYKDSEFKDLKILNG